jgi:hypothetical protein
MYHRERTRNRCKLANSFDFQAELPPIGHVLKNPSPRSSHGVLRSSFLTLLPCCCRPGEILKNRDWLGEIGPTYAST